MGQWRTVAVAFETAVYQVNHPGSLAGFMSTVRDGVEQFRKFVQDMLAARLSLTTADFELVTNFFPISTVSLQYADDGDNSAPSLEDSVRAIREWVLAGAGDPLVSSAVAELAQADELMILYALPSSVPSGAKFGNLGLATPVLGGDGKAYLHFIRGRIDGKPSKDEIANLLFHEWWHGVDFYLHQNFAADARTLVAWESSKPTNNKFGSEEIVVAPADGAPTTKKTIYHHHDDADLPIYETQWSPHLLYTRVRAGAPPAKMDSTRPGVVVFDESDQKQWTAFYAGLADGTRAAQWRATLGQQRKSEVLLWPHLSGDPTQWTAPQRSAIASLLNRLPRSFVEPLRSVRVLQGPRDEARIFYDGFVMGEAVWIDPAATRDPQLLARQMLFELARMWLRRKASDRHVMLEVLSGLAAGVLPFFDRVRDDFATEWAELAGWSVQHRDCLPPLTLVWIICKLLPRKPPNTVWGHYLTGGLLGLAPGTDATFTTDPPPRDIYDDFADSVVAYVFGDAAWSGLEAAAGKRSLPLDPRRREFIREHVMEKQEFAVTAVRPAPVSAQAVRRLRVANVVDVGGGCGCATHGEPVVAPPGLFVGAPAQLRSERAERPPVPEAITAAVRTWGADASAPTAILARVRQSIDAMRGHEPLRGREDLLRLLELHGDGLLGPAELRDKVGFQPGDLVFSDDGRDAVVVTVDGQGSPSLFIRTSASQDAWLTTTTAFERERIAWVGRPAGIERSWSSGESGAQVGAMLRVLIDGWWRERDRTRDTELGSTREVFELALREAFPGPRERPAVPSEAVEVDALYAFMTAHGAGLVPFDVGRPLAAGTMLWLVGGNCIGVVDRWEGSTPRSVVTGGRKNPSTGRGGIAVTKSFDVASIVATWTPSLTRRAWVRPGEAVPDWYADFDAAALHMLAHVGLSEVTRGGADQAIGAGGVEVLLSLLVEVGASAAAREAFGRSAWTTNGEQLFCELQRFGDGVALADGPIARGSLIGLHTREPNRLVCGWVLDVEDGVPTRIIAPGADLVGRKVLVLVEARVPAERIRWVWRPTGQPRVFDIGPDPFYRDPTEVLAQVLRNIGHRQVTLDTSPSDFDSSLTLVRLLAVRAPTALRDRLAATRDDDLVSLLDTLGDGVRPPDLSTLRPGVVVGLRGGRAGVVLSVDTQRAAVEVAATGGRLEHIRRLPLAEVDWAWRPAVAARVWAGSDVSPEYTDVNALLNGVRVYDGHHEINYVATRDPVGLFNSSLILGSPHVRAGTRRAFAEASDMRDCRNVAATLGEGLRARGTATVRVGDWLFFDDGLGLVFAVADGQPTTVACTGPRLRVERGAGIPRWLDSWCPASQPRSWPVEGHPVSSAYGDVSRLINDLIRFVGYRDSMTGHPWHTPAGLTLGPVVESRGLDATVRRRLAAAVHGVTTTNQQFWEKLAALDGGLHDPRTTPIAPGDFLQLDGGELCVAARVSDDAVEGIRTGYRVAFERLPRANLRGFWRPG